MEPRVTLITLGVRDLARSRRFYTDLGWTPTWENDDVVFFQAGRQAIAIWSRAALAADAGVDDDDAAFTAVALAQNARSMREVDAIVAKAASAGAEVTRAPADTFYGGYAGYVRDPDGHLWEIAWNPGFPLDEHGGITIPPGDERT